MLSRLFLVIGRRARCSRRPSAGSCCAFTSWRGVFAVLAVYGLLLLAVGAFARCRETLPPERRQQQRRRAARCAATGGCSRDRAYVGLVLVAGLTMAGAVQLRVRLVVRLPGASSAWTSSSSGCSSAPARSG